MISIRFDFSTVKCDLMHENAYTSKKCEICGEDFSELAPHIDPKVELRKEFLNSTFSLIESKKQERKTWFKKLRKGEVFRNLTNEPFDKLQEVLSKLNDIVKRQPLENVEILSDDLKNEKTIADIKLFDECISSLYDLKFDVEQIEFTTIWKNMSRRLINTIGYYIGGYEDIIHTAIAPNLEMAKMLQIKGQEGIDFASSEMNILGRIIENQRLMLDIDIFDGGEINQSALTSMVFGNNGNSPTEVIEDSNRLTEYYFRSLLKSDFFHGNIITLAPYMYMGTSVFDDADYFNKIGVVTNILEKAMQNDVDRFKSFSIEYVEKFLYARQTALNVATDFAFIIGNKPTDEMLMRHSIKWYKDMSEGAYKDSSRLVYFALMLLGEKEFENDDILEWLGFGEIVGSFESNSKYQLKKLTEGVVRIIRNSEAHVDYNVEDGCVILRNKIIRKDKRELKTEDYTYDDFFDITNKLIETVFAIICGVHLHLLNNTGIFYNELKLIEKNESKIANSDMISTSFALNGIIILSKQIDEKNVNIEGVINREIEDSAIIDVILSACVHSSLHVLGLHEINFELYDFDNRFINHISVPMKYLYMYSNEQSDFKDYYLLITKLLCDSKTILPGNLINDKDILCLKSIYVLLMEIGEKINYIFRDRDMKYNNRIKSELIIIMEKLMKVDRFLDVYEVHNDDMVLFNFSKILVNQMITVVKHVKQTGLMTRTIGEDFNNIKIMADSFVLFSEYIDEKITKEKFIKEFLKMNPYLPKRISVNSPCPCGSGKKYKKCCG